MAPKINKVLKVKNELTEKNESTSQFLELEKFAYKRENTVSIHTEIAHQKIGIEKLTNKKLKWEPPNWEDQYAMIREMRSDWTAPVDTMGCDAISNSDPILTEKVRMSI